MTQPSAGSLRIADSVIHLGFTRPARHIQEIRAGKRDLKVSIIKPNQKAKGDPDGKA